MSMTSAQSPRRGAGKRFLSVIVVCATVMASCHQAFADIFVTASESDGKTTIEWSGSLDVSKLNFVGVVDAPQSSLFPKWGLLSASNNEKLDGYLLRSVQPRSFGEGAAALPVKNSGDPILVTNTVSGDQVCLCLPRGYKGGPLRGKLEFADAGIAGLGIDTKPFFYDLGGQYIYFFPSSDTFTHTKNVRIKKVLAMVLPTPEKRVVKIRAFVEGNKNSDSEVASVEVRPVSGR